MADGPGAVALGCIDIAPEVIEVPCLQSHDAIVWATVNAGESCPDGTEGFFRPAVGVYCATLVVG